MKLLGRWSLASFIKLVIDVPYYFLLVVLPIVFAIALWLALTPGHGGSVQIEIPVRLQLDAASHAIVISRHDIQAVSITQAHGTLQVRSEVSRMGIAWAGLGGATESSHWVSSCSFSSVCGRFSERSGIKTHSSRSTPRGSE